MRIKISMRFIISLFNDNNPNPGSILRYSICCRLFSMRKHGCKHYGSQTFKRFFDIHELRRYARADPLCRWREPFRL